MIDVNQFIEINNNIRFGKATIKGTRITVVDILNWLSEEMKINDIITDFPQLNKEQILACLKYAASKNIYLQRS